ncbi:MAG: GspE/PulE family protein, partial [Pseudomonadota bacterium]
MIEFDYDLDDDDDLGEAKKASTPLETISSALNLSEFVIARANEAIAASGQSAIVVLTKLGMVSDQDVAHCLAQMHNVPFAAPEEQPSSPVLHDEISPIFLVGNLIVPLSVNDNDNELTIAVADPMNEVAIDALSYAVHPKTILLKILPISEIEKVLRSLYGETLFEEGTDSQISGRQTFLHSDAETLKNLAREEPIIRLLDRLLSEAIDAKATDVHIESKANAVSLRMRVDGKLRPLPSLSVENGPPLISRLKILADLDVANSRSPQDGRASITNRGRSIDIRVSTVPAAFGESVAVRILDRAAVSLNFDDLGIVGDAKNTLVSLIRRSYGLTIITGPTGSGKTTTLYAALNLIRDSKLKILTIEDPIEFRFEEVNQVQVNNAAGVSFASALRAFLRQDPDIILIGEIRDTETAQIAVQAALTGHLVLATLHTND